MCQIINIESMLVGLGGHLPDETPYLNGKDAEDAEDEDGHGDPPEAKDLLQVGGLIIY